MEKKNLIIMLDFTEGPLWKDKIDPATYESSTGIDAVDNDEFVQKINDEIYDLYASYYKIDYKDEAVYFDFEQEKKDKYKMLDLLNQLNKRLEELNDGSFVVDDRETERVRNL